MKRAYVICALMLIIAYSGYRVFGQRLDAPTGRDRFIYGVAIEFKDAGLCGKIAPYAEGHQAGLAPSGFQISYLQSDCYFHLAATLQEASLCDRVRPLRKGFVDGSKMTPEYCRAELHSWTARSGEVVPPDVIVPMMRKLGYLDQEIHDSQYRGRESNPVYNAYSQLRKDGLFAEKIKAAPMFDEPVSAAKIRPANDLEYVYQMFAVDIDDSIFCDKISPNAEAEWPNQRRFMLKPQCNLAIALDKRDLSVCEKLPARSSALPGAADYNSREACRHDIEVMWPDGGHYRYGPAYPPTFSSFQNGLHALGYDPIFPELTSNDYEEFLLRLSDPRQTTIATRTEFLGRVATMK
jgi:hypothetical protein